MVQACLTVWPNPNVSANALNLSAHFARTIAMDCGPRGTATD